MSFGSHRRIVPGRIVPQRKNPELGDVPRCLTGKAKKRPHPEKQRGELEGFLVYRLVHRTRRTSTYINQLKSARTEGAEAFF